MTLKNDPYVTLIILMKITYICASAIMRCSETVHNVTVMFSAHTSVSSFLDIIDCGKSKNTTSRSYPLA